MVWFNSNDHTPAHFHMKKLGGRRTKNFWEIRVFILTTTKSDLDYKFKIPKNRKEQIPGWLQKTIRDKVVSFRAELLKEWEDKVIV
jgi:hypothetical protein